MSSSAAYDNSSTPSAPTPAPCPAGRTTTHSVFHLPSQRFKHVSPGFAVPHSSDSENTSNGRPHPPKSRPAEWNYSSYTSPCSVSINAETQQCGSKPPNEYGPLVSEEDITAIRSEVEMAGFTPRVTVAERNAARIAALRLDIQRDADDLARLERKLQHIRNRQETLRVAKKALKWDEDPRVVDELMEWGWKDRRVEGLIKRVSGVVSVVAAEVEDCGEGDEEEGGVEEEEVDEEETSGEK